MHKRIAALLAMAFILTGATAFASPTADFNKGAVIFEIGSTVNSKVNGQGQYLSKTIDGRSGFKYAVTAGLGNNLALQFKQGKFKSEDATFGPLTTYAKAEPIDINLLYRINPHLTAIAGYEHDKVTYGNYVQAASKSSLHIGLTGTHQLNDKTALFATLVSGQDVSLREIGVSRQLAADTTVNVSYAERKFNHMDMNVPVLSLYDTFNYKMTGITCVLAFKL